MTRLRERGYRQTGECFGVRRIRSRRHAVLRTCCDSDAEMYEYSECAYDTAGKVVATEEYGAYGTIRRTTGAVPIYGWCGMLGIERDAATGLLFMRARYYSPMLGRFITRDPIGLSAGDINWYRYCGNAPLLAVDPSGLIPWTVICKGLLGFKAAIDVVSPYVGILGMFVPGVGVAALALTAASVALNIVTKAGTNGFGEGGYGVADAILDGTSLAAGVIGVKVPVKTGMAVASGGAGVGLAVYGLYGDIQGFN